jgi:tetratricopeptide (TPR) repeat protein
MPPPPSTDRERAEQEFQAATEAHRAGRLDEAIEGYARVLRLQPRHGQCCNNLGVALRAQGKFQAAVAAYCRALAETPDNAGTHSNLGNALRSLGRFAEAETCHRRAIEIDPDFTEAHYNLGIALKDQRRIDEALACFDAVLTKNPDHVDAHWDRALAWLVAGDFEQGWPEYEWRWRLAEHAPRELTQPLWDGGDLEGRTILLHAEQGMGDSIQFARYAPLVAARGGRVLLECPPPLARLFESLDGIAEIIPQGGALPDFDTHAPLLSLPGILGTSGETIPCDVPYLSADRERAKRLRGQLADLTGGLKVGLVWAGKPSHKNDRNRSLDFESVVGLLGLKDIFYFSLQIGPRADDLRTAGCDGLITDLSGSIKDFADTAIVLEALDLLVTVDTSPAHLAGALGKPVWVLLPYVPDWRWLLERDDSPWYPSLRLFRQERPNDWSSPLRRLAEALKTRAGEITGDGGGPA